MSDAELVKIWLNENWDEIMDFYKFKKMYLKSIEEKMKNYELALLFDEVKKSNLSQEVIDMIEKVFKIADDNKIKL